MVEVMIVVHVLAATVWTGGHLVLALTVLPKALRANDPAIIEGFEAGYERIGLPALLLQVITGFWLAFERFPRQDQWFTSEPASALLTAKLVVLATTVGLAMHARLKILPDLDASKLRALAWHIVPVTVLSVVFVVLGVGIRLRV